MRKELRPLQAGAIADLRASLVAGQRRVMLQLPTGGGKTVIAAHIVESAQAKGKRVLFTVPAIALVDQTVEAFWAQGVRDIGVIQAQHSMTDWSKPVQIASVQTLQKRTLPKADVVLIDEAHKWFRFYEKWFFDAEWKDIPIIGLSATPWTKGLGRYYQKLIVAGTTEALIEQGSLSPFRVFAPSHPELTGVRTVAGDYHEGDLSDAMNKAPLIADVVQTWLKLGENRPTMCFAVDRAHAKHLQQQFEAAGVPCGYQDAHSKDADRREIKRQFHNGEIKVVCNVGTLTTGVDWDVRCIIFARPTKSKMLFVQIAGRGLRTANGKDNCIAEGSLVLTDGGIVPIELVTKAMKVWDGESWVSHDGVICRGEQEVIEYAGLIATPDHEVWTENGWKTLAKCSCEQIGIAITERNGKAVRLSENHFAQDASEQNSERVAGPARAGGMRDLFKSALDFILEHSARPVSRLPWLQSTAPSAELVGAAHERRQASLLQSEVSAFLGLWWPWNKVQFSVAAGCRDVGAVEPWSGPIKASRPDRERWSLRGRKPSAFDRNAEYVPHAGVYSYAAASCLSAGLSGGEVRRCDAEANDERGHVGRGDSGSLGEGLLQAKGRVWDILNAGPLHRFTVSGRLVSNCLFLDHSDNHLRLGFVTDIHQDKLDNGKTQNVETQERIALPKECPQCAFLKAPRCAVCPNCGFKAEVVSNVEFEDGELKELKKPKRKEFSQDEKQRWYSMLLGVVQQRGYKSGWAANQYKQKFAVWPRGLSEHSMEPDQDVLNYVKHSMIRYAKRRRAETAQPMSGAA